MLTHHAFRVAILFMAAGLLSRFTFRVFETRWQIAIFCALAALYQLAVRPAFGLSISPWSLALDLAVITLAIVAMKVVIEGHL